MEELIKFIEANDISGARAVLQNEILWNTSSKEDVNNMIELCDKNEVFDEHDGKMLSYNIAEYDDEQLLNLKSDLTFNFSKERYILAYKVSRVLNEKIKVKRVIMNYQKLIQVIKRKKKIQRGLRKSYL